MFKEKMNSAIFKCLSLLILSLVWNNIPFVNASNFRPVKTYHFEKGQYYDTIKYEWDITPTEKVGMFDYNIQSNGAVSTLLMNSTDYYNWQTRYYPEWLNKHEYTFTYLNDDFRTFQCKSPVAACTRYDIKFPDKKLYVIVLRTNDYADTTYTFEDDLERLKNKSAKLVYDPKYPPQTTVTPNSNTTMKKTTTNELVSSSSSKITSSEVTNSAVAPQTSSSSINPNGNGINDANNINGNNTNVDNSNKMNNIDGNNKDNNTKNVESNKSNWLWPLIVFGTLFVLLMAALPFASKNRKKNDMDNSREIPHENTLPFSGVDNRSDKGKVPYNPHHAVKRVAYHYESEDIVVERDSILEITKRYNDGWATVVNPKDGKESLIPLIVLEGDINEDLTNIPVEEKSPKSILATPESLYENQYISRKDYEEMKRNDEWIKKVKLMKHGKPDSSQNIMVDNEQIKYVSHPINETIENDISQTQPNTNRKSMVATVVNSNTDLLSADHILEVCDEDDYDYEPEQGVIMKNDL
ncbi:hypothetical protein PIROE2DRAFT_69816 [Piromyces sp. E2]|nr:hypothetical protein PIROE2DRAFT_69816 [Piromyces sp. E2]|eukprot:OUM59702.1 hypothetical protein PIROE2DRAFT_69816 [Piromyces sp. E2]